MNSCVTDALFLTPVMEFLPISKQNYGGLAQSLLVLKAIYRISSYIVFPHIVSALEYFPPFNKFRTFMYCDLWPYVL